MNITMFGWLTAADTISSLSVKSAVFPLSGPASADRMRRSQKPCQSTRTQGDLDCNCSLAIAAAFGSFAIAAPIAIARILRARSSESGIPRTETFDSYICMINTRSVDCAMCATADQALDVQLLRSERSVGFFHIIKKALTREAMTQAIGEFS